MTYTVADLDAAIENEESEWEGSWHEFQERVEDTYYFEKDASGEYVRNENGGLVRVPLETPGVALPSIGQAVIEKSFGGEGQGDDYWFVFKVTDSAGNERLFRRNGWYASYSGGEYDGPTDEVKPVPKTITVYESI